mmetsp:Transcript_18079/g.50195  ORF Transcript_18079/g.50195 Transcript_18079/m.50195 type:complete len:203 (-) Transcript_18079:658-1266(-)
MPLRLLLSPYSLMDLFHGKGAREAVEPMVVHGCAHVRSSRLRRVITKTACSSSSSMAHQESFRHISPQRSPVIALTGSPPKVNFRRRSASCTTTSSSAHPPGTWVRGPSMSRNRMVNWPHDCCQVSRPWAGPTPLPLCRARGLGKVRRQQTSAGPQYSEDCKAPGGTPSSKCQRICSKRKLETLSSSSSNAGAKTRLVSVPV